MFNHLKQLWFESIFFMEKPVFNLLTINFSLESREPLYGPFYKTSPFCRSANKNISTTDCNATMENMYHWVHSPKNPSKITRNVQLLMLASIFKVMWFLVTVQLGLFAAHGWPLGCSASYRRIFGLVLKSWNQKIQNIIILIILIMIAPYFLLHLR